jgi:hypothetical protein
MYLVFQTKASLQEKNKKNLIQYKKNVRSFNYCLDLLM